MEDPAEKLAREIVLAIERVVDSHVRHMDINAGAGTFEVEDLTKLLASVIRRVDQAHGAAYPCT